MSTNNPLVTRYIEQFRAGLGRLRPADRDELVREIESHIAEATEAGRPLAEVLEKLGPADKLARAYSAELLLDPNRTNGTRGSRLLAVIGLVAAASLPSLIIVPLLGGLCLGFTLGGAGAILAGVATLIFPEFVQPNFLPYGLAQSAAILIGAVLAALGVGAGYGLVGYVKLIVKGFRKAME